MGMSILIHPCRHYYQIWRNQCWWSTPNSHFHLSIFIVMNILRQKISVFTDWNYRAWMNMYKYKCVVVSLSSVSLSSVQEGSGFALTEPKNIWGGLPKKKGQCKIKVEFFPFKKVIKKKTNYKLLKENL